ncbi:GreA/GreB family elongation factor [Acetivibrio cellulolyticus]|uniref:GreA/GreB family elongation factor n=1 Tax=Acetivibrio cellulolyticus TaxID=35830 RepID=UPI0001E2F5A7|nr:GreA/GreB family elongation factor [Acetivibrio cellulolyticus]
MQKKLTLTQQAYENLLAHLVDFEERRKHIIMLYFPEYNSQRVEFEVLIDDYISALDDVVRNVSFSDKSGNDFPFVCLNSVIEVEDVENTETFNYMLILPEANDYGTNCITILSPMGKALLCKKDGETVSVNTPSGVYRYRIKSIKLQ